MKEPTQHFHSSHVPLASSSVHKLSQGTDCIEESNTFWFLSNTRSFECTTLNPKNSTKPKTPVCTPPECNIRCNIFLRTWSSMRENRVTGATWLHNQFKTCGPRYLQLSTSGCENKRNWETEFSFDLWKTRNMYLYAFIATDTSVLERHFPPSRTTEGNFAPASQQQAEGFQT